MSEERTVTTRESAEVVSRDRMMRPGTGRLEALVGRLAAALESSPPLERASVLGRALEDLAESIDADCAWLSRMEANGEVALLQEWSADLARRLPSRDVESRFLCAVPGRGELVAVAAAPRRVTAASAFDGLEVDSLLSLPLVVAGSTIGCLAFAAVRPPERWGLDEVALLGLAASRMAAVVALESESSFASDDGPGRGAFDVLDDSVELRELNGKLVDINAAACALYGYERDELLALDFRAYIHSTSHGDFERALGRVAGGVPVHTFIHALRRDGSIVDLDVRALPMDVHGQRHMLSILRDEARLPAGRSEEEFRSVVATAPDQIWRIDLEGRIVYTNRPESEERENPILAHKLLDLAPPEDRQQIEDAFDRVIQQRTKVYFESHDMEGRLYSNHLGPFVRDGRVVGLTGISRDITELKEAQRQHEANAAILQLLATSSPFEAVLDSITRMVDDTSSDLYCSSWRVDSRSHRLSLLSAPSMADEALSGLNGCRVDVDPGPLGTSYRRGGAALRRDLDPTESSPDYVRDLFDAGMTGCWIQPSRDQRGRVMVLLVVFTKVPRGPSASESDALRSATRLARLACEHWTSEDRRQRSESAVRALHEVTSSPHLGFDEQVRRLLAMGRESFELDIGILARIEGDRCCVVQADAPAALGLNSGSTIELCETYCRETVESEVPIGFASTDGTAWARHPAFAKYSRHAYLGTRVLVGDEVWGTLSFSSMNRREEPFGPAELNLIQLMARWVGSELERQRNEEALHLAQLSLERSSEGAFWLGPDGRFVFVNEQACTMLDYSRDELTGLAVPDVDVMVTPTGWPGLWAEIRANDRLVFDSVLVRKTGARFPAEISANYVTFRGREYIFAFVRDITDRRKTDEDRKRLERMLRQSQKMEALGQLAGGVAHDFNNLLTAILGNTEILLSAGELPDSNRPALEQIGRAGERAASLTRQLLAFSRKQARELKVLELNRVVGDMESMLQRLIGENIQLETSLASDVGKVVADTAQIEQVILNLALNARDAMKDGGRLRLTTARVVLDAEEISDRVNARPGPHVVITVTDTGKGMDQETLNHIFEPFFTTKPVGEGTGLGLSTVYGIVTQAGGHITVESRPDRGTRFAAFLPATDAEDVVEAVPSLAVPLTGEETILVCEDEWMVRDLACKILESAGYHVLGAPDGRRALELAERYDGSIDLLLTDTVMPEVSGAELARELTTSRPGTSVLFMSGYTSDVLARHGVDELHTELLGKPFSAKKLLERVRRVLDSATRSG